jgi:hypothetical protein
MLKAVTRQRLVKTKKSLYVLQFSDLQGALIYETDIVTCSYEL